MADLQELIDGVGRSYGAVGPTVANANVLPQPPGYSPKEDAMSVGRRVVNFMANETADWRGGLAKIQEGARQLPSVEGLKQAAATGKGFGMNVEPSTWTNPTGSRMLGGSGIDSQATNPPQVSSVTKPAANPPAAATEKPKTLLGDDATKKGVKLNTPIAEPAPPPDVVSPKLGDDATQQGVTLNDELAGGYGMDFLKNLHQLDKNRQGEMANQERAAERDRFYEQTRLDNLLAKARETKTEWIHNEKGGGWKEVTVPANPVEASLAKEILAERNAYGAMPQAELAEAKKSDFQRYNAELGLLGNITKEQSNAKAALAGKLMDYNMNQAKLDLETKKFVAQQGLDYDKLTAEQRQKQAELYLNMSKAQSEMDQNTWKNYEVKNEMGNPDPKQTLWNIFQAFKDNPDAAPVNLRPQLASIRDQYVTWRKNWLSQFKGKNPSQADFDAMNEGFKQNIRLM